MVDLSELKEQLGPSQRELMQQVNALVQEIQTLQNDVQARDQGIAERDDYIAKLEGAIKERDEIIEKLIVKIKSKPKQPPKKVIIHRTQVQQQPCAPLMQVDLPRPEPEISEREYLQRQLNKVGAYNPNTAAGTNWLEVWNKKRPNVKL